jgi:hypothetical protein
MESIHRCGSEDQKERWPPRMAGYETIGAFARTEPDAGSDVARGLATSARRDGDGWVLNGRKRWIGNGTFADVIVVWARDDDDGQVKGFLIERGTPGLSATKMCDRIALRVVQNAELQFEDCHVAETARLPGARSFADTGAVLAATRAHVAWQAIGCACGAYRAARHTPGAASSWAGPSDAFSSSRTFSSACSPTSLLAMSGRAPRAASRGRPRHGRALLQRLETARGGWRRRSRSTTPGDASALAPGGSGTRRPRRRTLLAGNESRDWATPPPSWPNGDGNSGKLRHFGPDTARSSVARFAGKNRSQTPSFSSSENRGVPGSSPGLAIAAGPEHPCRDRGQRPDRFESGSRHRRGPGIPAPTGDSVRTGSSPGLAIAGGPASLPRPETSVGALLVKGLTRSSAASSSAKASSTASA